jgi:hypothetical protein
MSNAPPYSTNLRATQGRRFHGRFLRESVGSIFESRLRIPDAFVLVIGHSVSQRP